MKLSKKILALFLSLALLLPLLPASALAAEDEAFTINNGYIEVNVSKRNGGFLVNTAEGNLLKKSDNNKDLLYHSGTYDTSFVSIRVGEGADARDYLFGGEYDGASDISVSQETQGGPISAVWSVDGITFTQTVSLAADDANQHGMVSVALAALNNTGKAQRIQARVLLDTCLGDQDFAHYQVFKSDNITYTIDKEELIEDKAAILSFSAVDDIANPLVTAYMISNDISKAAIGHWNDLAASLFDFSPRDLTFTNSVNEFLTADSACALYYDIGSVESGALGSVVSYYGVYSNKDVPVQNSVAVNLEAPLRLELNDAKNAYIRLSDVGAADFAVRVTAENYESETAEDIKNVILAVQTTNNLRCLSDSGAEMLDFDYGSIDPMTISYSKLEVGQPQEKQLYFKARPLVGASYERVTVGVYKGSVTRENLLGEKTVYILLPGSDGDIPKVTFMSMTPDAVYSSGTRHLFVAITNEELFKRYLGDGRCAFSAYSADGKKSWPIASENINVSNGVADIAITEEQKLPVGNYYLQLDWTDEAVQNKLVEAKFQHQTSTALSFKVSDDPKLKNDCYGVLAAVKYEEGTGSGHTYYYRLENFKDEAAFKAFAEQTGDAKKWSEIIYVFRGEFVGDKRYPYKDADRPGYRYYTAVSKKEIDKETREAKVDNLITINNCLDFEGGTMTVYYEDYANSNAGFAVQSPILVEFDGELYTSEARTSVWTGQAAFTKLEQGKDFVLIEYDKNGNREDLKADQSPVTLIWPNVFSYAQTLAGLAFKFAYGQLGVLKEDGKEIGRTIAFAASLNLSFMKSPQAADDTAPPDTYFGRMKELWSDWRGASIYQYAYHGNRFNKLVDIDMNDSTDAHENAQKGVAASVMVKDILFGSAKDSSGKELKGFIGLNFSVKLLMRNLIDSLPKIEGTLSVNTINNWSFGLEGNCKLTNNLKMEASLKFKSYENIPVPDELYFYVGGFKPGLNIDGCGVVWITGGGGGFSNLYDTIFCTSGLPPLKLILKVGFSIMQVLDGEAKLQVALSGIDLTATNIKILGTIECIKKIQLGLQWYPDLKLQAGIYVSMFEKCIEGQGYIVLLGKDYTDWFFEMFIKAALKIPESVPVVGGMDILAVELGVNTEKIWGAFEALGIGVGVTYYWGEDSVNFGDAKNKAHPTYPNLLTQSGDGSAVPIAYDEENGRTLYAHFGTNFEPPVGAQIVGEGELFVMDANDKTIRSDATKTSHVFNLGAYNNKSALVQISYPAESIEKAGEIAKTFKISANSDGTGNTIPLTLAKHAPERGENESLEDYEARVQPIVNYNKNANANISWGLVKNNKDEDVGYATLSFTATEASLFSRDWYLKTGEHSANNEITAGVSADIVLYNVLPIPKLTSVSASGSLAAGAAAEIAWAGENVGDLESIKFSLVGSTDPADENAESYPLTTASDNKDGITDGTVIASGHINTLTVPAGIPAGDYYLRAVYAKDDQVNGMVHSTVKYHVANGNTPAALSGSIGVSSIGDLKFAVTVPETDDANTTGYSVTVYDANGEPTDIAGVSIDRAKTGATEFEIGGSFVNAQGEKTGLTGGRDYKIGITPYKTFDTSGDSKPDAAVFGSETIVSAHLNDYAMPTASVSVGSKTIAAISGTKASATGAASAQAGPVFTANELAVSASFSEPVSGTWALDSGDFWSATQATNDASVISGSFTNAKSLNFSLEPSALAEGDHIISFFGKASDGDSFLYSYPFTVDTQAPRLIISSPLSGSSFGTDGKVTVTGVTDSDALITVNIDGAPALSRAAVSTDASGLFTLTADIPDYNGAATRSVEIYAEDAAGNRTDKSVVTVAHPGLGQLSSIYIMAGSTVPFDGNLYTMEAGSAKLSLVGKTASGTTFALDPDRVSWNSLAAEGSAAVSSSGTLSWTDDTRGYVEAMIEVSGGAYRRASLTLGDAPNAAYISLSSTLGGTATGGGQYNPGDTVTLTAEPDEGYVFDRWEIEGLDDISGLDLYSPVLSFTMPNAKIKVTAVFRSKSRRVIANGDDNKEKEEDKEKAGAPSAPLTNGTLSFSRHTLAPTQKPETCVAYYVDENGNTVILPLAIAEDGELLVLAPEGVEVKYMDKPVSFSDTAGHWAERSMNWAASHGLFNGVGDGKFDPNGKMTRAMFVTVLYRIAGSPKTSGKTDFADLKADSWYENAVTWAVANGIVNGVSATAFAPDANITREQMCSLVARFLTALGYPVAEGEGVKFSDEASVSSWAADDVAFCQRTGIINGKPDGSFDPKANATRAENAAVMERMIESILTSLSEAE